MFQIHGLLVIPEEPKLSVVSPDSSSGFFINFTAVTQERVVNGEAKFNHWDCSVYLPSEAKKNEWLNDFIVPGTILLLENATAISVPILDGKYHNTKIKLDHYKTKKLVQPLWLSE